MSDRLRRLAFCILAAVLVVGLAVPAQARTKRHHAPQGNPLYASIVMDADTGLILQQENPDRALHPASLTKMMTLLLTFDALQHGRLRLNDRITMSAHAAGMAPSKLGLDPGDSIRVEDAIYAVVTKSANDIAVALGERLGGTESQFAVMMTRKAADLGMVNTRFVNASGLHDPRQVSSPRDMAKLARALINDYPSYYHYFGTKSFRYQGVFYANHNHLMSQYKGMDGLKTGFIGPSGFNLVASAMRNNRRLIGVVFGGRSATSRNAQMARLLDAGFDRINDIRVAQAEVPLPPRKPVAPDGDVANDAAGGNDAKLAALQPALQGGAIGAIIGEGDYDPPEAGRFETGMMAIKAVRGRAAPHTTSSSIDPAAFTVPLGQAGAALASKFMTPDKPSEVSVQSASYEVPSAPSGRWAVQIGAFTSRVTADRIIRDALGKLPEDLSGASPLIIPTQSGDSWIFRARIGGYSKSEAVRACAYFRDCVTVAPGVL